MLSMDRSPHVPYRVSEICNVESLESWTNIKVCVVGRIVCNYGQKNTKHSCASKRPPKLAARAGKTGASTPKDASSSQVKVDLKTATGQATKCSLDDTKALELSFEGDELPSFTDTEEFMDDGFQCEKPLNVLVECLNEARLEREAAGYPTRPSSPADEIPDATLYSVMEPDGPYSIQVNLRLLPVDGIKPPWNNTIVTIYGELNVDEGHPWVLAKIVRESNNLMVKNYYAAVDYLRKKFPDIAR